MCVLHPRSVFLLFNIALGAYILGTITLLVVKNDERTGRYRDLSSNLKTYRCVCVGEGKGLVRLQAVAPCTSQPSFKPMTVLVVCRLSPCCDNTELCVSPPPPRRLRLQPVEPVAP